MTDYRGMFREAIAHGKQRNYRDAIALLRRIVTVTDEIEEAYLYLGRSYHAVGDYPRAVDSLRRFIDLRPGSSAGHFFLGRSYLSAKEYVLSASSLEKALELRPDLSYAKSLLGYIYLKLRRSSRAVELLAEAVRDQPDNPALYTGYLNALLIDGIKMFRQGFHEYAEEAFRFIVDQGDGGILPHLYLGMIHRIRGETGEALSEYQEALRHAPGDDLIRYRIAVLTMKAGRQEEASELFSRLSRNRGSGGAVMPTAVEADRHLAKKYFERGNYSQALHHALQLLHTRKNDAEMHLLAGECYREIGEHEYALNHFNRVFDTDRGHIGAHYGIALVHWQQEEYTRMLDVLRKVESLDPGNQTVHYYTVLCNWKLEAAPERLLPVVQEAVRSFGPDPFLFTALADTYVRGGYPELGEKWYRKILLIDEKRVDAYRGIIDIFLDTGQGEDIEPVFERYLELVPDDLRYRRAFIRHLYEKGDYRLTIEKVEEYLSLRSADTDEDNLYFQRIRAICYRKSGEYDIAAELYRRLLRREPEKEEFLRPYIYCLEKSGRRELAADTARKAIEYLASPSATLCLIAGVLLFKEDRKEQALELFRKATDLDPVDWRGYYNIGEIYRMQGMNEFAGRFLARAEKLRGAGVPGTGEPDTG